MKLETVHLIFGFSWGAPIRLQDSFSVTKGENEMDTKKLLRYTMQLAMLKQLLTKKLIDENEYSLIQKRLMKDYGIVSLVYRNGSTHIKWSEMILGIEI